jgi:uncharacterized protein (DUF4415 family)
MQPTEQLKPVKRMNALIRELTNKSRAAANKRSITFRIDSDVEEMLRQAQEHHPIVSRIINEALRQALKANGYRPHRTEKAA